jgi:hypothetical protein
MRNKARPDPTIPDHEVLRKIGGGSYGEVWLARSVTGALRAIKVVWREDFDDERGFEREFEGILKFEPISRDHPGLMNILHVGRSPDGFYFYVMELGDDIVTGRDINPVEYKPRTLREDGAAVNVPLALDLVIDVGVRLAEALEHLHERGLAHRDVKPSNVIFVNGRAKLADIGLVAARGQRTFVGTEGFVPPEGPGSAQADVYSLGKVLYEIATGNDRLQFPELPEELPEDTNRKRWLSLNHIICDVCEPYLAKRGIRTAGELAEALRGLQRGKRHRRRRSPLSVVVTTTVLTAGMLVLGWEVLRNSPWSREWAPLIEAVGGSAVETRMGQVRIVSYPEGADVFDASGQRVGTTPTQMLVPVGRRAVFSIRQSGFRPVEIDHWVSAAAVGDPLVLGKELEIFRPPQAGEPWVDHLGMKYLPVDQHHVSAGYVTEAVWRRFERQARRAEAGEVIEVSERGEKRKVVAVTEADAAAFANWATETGKTGYLREDDYYLAVMADSGFQGDGLTAKGHESGLRPFSATVCKIPYATLELATVPPGADVFIGNELVGNTSEPLRLTRIKPGRVRLRMLLEGYKPKQVDLMAGADGLVSYVGELVRNQGVRFGRDWENGLGMKFVPLGPDLMASIYETRVSDYAPFAQAIEARRPPKPEFHQTEDHPVVSVSREDAEAFCLWLTARERAQERIGRSHYYRLPTDLEWSLMAFLVDESGATPGERDARKEAIFPWGREWPPDRLAAPVGNLADRTAAQSPGTPQGRSIPNYVDGFASTSPVGSFPPNARGIYDLCGNVHEWVGEDYSKTARFGVLRGGGWKTYQQEHLVLGWRNAVPPGFRDNIYGFRVVLAKESSADPNKQRTNKE